MPGRINEGGKRTPHSKRKKVGERKEGGERKEEEKESRGKGQVGQVAHSENEEIWNSLPPCCYLSEGTWASYFFLCFDWEHPQNITVLVVA